MSRLLTRRSAFLFSALLLAALVVLTGCPDDGGGGPPANPIDSDADLLIDISSIERLNNIRHNLAGTAYQASASANAVQCGAAADTACRGYELTRSLDFADPDSYESGVVSTALRPNDTDPANATNSGWVPIGAADITPFTTRFEGNGNTITNLYTRGSNRGGLFGATENAVISNIGVINARLYGSDNVDFIGGLVGFATNTTIVASYANGGTIDGGAEGDDAGGLLGHTIRGTVVASYASGTVNGGAGSDSVGGLMGSNSSIIRASYADVDVNGGAGNNDNVGGLIGLYNTGVSFVASYATGNSAGGEGTNDNAGAFIGNQFPSATPADFTTASYGFGMADGESSNGFTPNLPTNVRSATGLTLANAGSEWNDAASLSLNAWDFGNASQPPALRYADYDGSREVFACANADSPPADAILIVKCGELIPGQR